MFFFEQIRIIMDKLGTRAVRLAWYDSKKANEYVINGYTKVTPLSPNVILLTFGRQITDDRSAVRFRIGERG